MDALAGGLGRDFRPAGEGEEADYVVVGTCTVTADADVASRRAVRRAARQHPRARIFVTGCYAEVDPRGLAALPGVAAVVGARALGALPELLSLVHRGAAPGPALARAAVAAPAWTGPPRDSLEHARVLLKVQDGCDAGCSYCAVPAARGRARSLPFEEALARLAALRRRHAEVVLAGVRLGAYGRDLSPRRSLAELVSAAAGAGLPGRLRLSSIEPSEFPLGLLRQARTARILCEHFHLPVQSGSDRVLGAMRRPYRAGAIASLVEEIALGMPDACIGADVMVGFPGETAADHQATLRLLSSLPLAYLHVFPWSPRPGTPAAGMAGRVEAALVRERAREMQSLSARRWRRFLAAQSGRELEVVVERTEGGASRGTSRRYVPVRWPGCGDERGTLARVRIESSDGTECLGVRTGASSGRIRP